MELALNMGQLTALDGNELFNVDGGARTSDQWLAGACALALATTCVVLTLIPSTSYIGLTCFAECSDEIVSLADTFFYG